MEILRKKSKNDISNNRGCFIKKNDIYIYIYMMQFMTSNNNIENLNIHFIESYIIWIYLII